MTFGKVLRWIGLTGLLLLGAVNADAANITACASGCTYTTIQAAVDASACGDTIILKAGETYSQNVTLPAGCSGPEYRTITTDASASNLPAEGFRSGPSYQSFMPILRNSGGGPTIQLAPGAGYWKFTHLKFPNTLHSYYASIQCGTNLETIAADQPHHVIVDRVYMVGDPVDGNRNGVLISCSNLQITNSYFAQMVGMGQDSYCFAGANGGEHILIENNYCEGGGENFIFGGGDSNRRVRMTAVSGGSTTGAVVDVTEGNGRSLAEVAIGQPLAIDIASGGTVTLCFTNLTSKSSNGTTGVTLTWSPACAAAPDTTAGSIRWDAIIDDVKIYRNFFTKPTAWRDPILAAPANPAAVTSGSGSLSCNCYYKVVAVATGYAENTAIGAASAEVTANADGQGISISWTAVPGAESYRIYRGTSSGNQTGYFTDTASPFLDDGSTGPTSGTVPSPSLWVVKNLGELKVGTNVHIRGNIFEHLWRDDNFGSRFAWWIKVENQNDAGGAWDNRTSDVLIEYNIVRSAFGVLQAAGSYCVNNPGTCAFPRKVQRMTVKHNIAYDCGDDWSLTGGWLVVQLQDMEDFVMDHNTILCEDMHSAVGFPVGSGAPSNTNTLIKNNILFKGTNGLWGDNGSTEGSDAFSDHNTGTSSFLNNAIGGASCGGYPMTTICPTTMQFTDGFRSYVLSGAGADWRSDVSGIYDNTGSDGQDMGADATAVYLATRGVQDGVPAPTMAVRASASNTNYPGADSTAVTVSVPTGTAEGDVVVVIVHANNAGSNAVANTITDNNGSHTFTENLAEAVQTSHTASVFSRRWLSTDTGTSTLSFTLSSAVRWSVVAITFKYPHPFDVYDVVPTNTAAAGFSILTPTLTTTTDQAIHVAVGLADGVNTTIETTPFGYTVEKTVGGESIVVATKRITAPVFVYGQYFADLQANPGMMGISFVIKDTETATLTSRTPPTGITVIP